MENTVVYVMARWVVKKGELDKVLRSLKELAAATLAEEGNILYKVHQAKTDPNTLILYEGYKDSVAQQAHVGSVHFQSLVIGTIVPLLETRESILLGMLEL